jgi:hypothetical protein
VFRLQGRGTGDSQPRRCPKTQPRVRRDADLCTGARPCRPTIAGVAMLAASCGPCCCPAWGVAAETLV